MPSSGGKPKLSFPTPRPVRLNKWFRLGVYVLFWLFALNAIPVQRLSGIGFLDAWMLDPLVTVQGICSAILHIPPLLTAPRELTFNLLSDLTRFVLDSADANGLLVDQASVYLVVAACLLILHILLPTFVSKFLLWLLSWICGWAVSLFGGVVTFFASLTGIATSRTGGPGAKMNVDSPNSGLTPYLRKQINANYRNLIERSKRSATLPNRSYLRVQRLDAATNEPVTDEIKDWDIHNEITLSEPASGDKLLIKLEPNGRGAYIDLPAGGRRPLQYEKAQILKIQGGAQPYALTWFGGAQP